ncbi:MAG: DUF2156 domain-containing protein [Candidatus Omnitrophica bacterium]|nr:DUF2156 domain-containing protein [Candidatus Omnitrophota bacterium]
MVEVQANKGTIKDRLSSLSTFPDERGIKLEDKQTFDALFRQLQPEISEFSFTNLFCWQEAYSLAISRLDDFLIISSKQDDDVLFFAPLGNGDLKGIVRVCLKQVPGARVFRVPASLALLFSNEAGFKIKEDRDNYDYIYRRVDLVELKGKKYDAKRNFIRRFINTYKPVLRKMSEADIENCLKFQEEWCDYRSCGNDAGLMREKEAIREMLSNFEALQLSGVVIEINAKLEAFSLGEKLNDTTFVVHAEKGNGKFVGIYQAINNFFASSIPESFSFINREQDLGLMNLRKAKTSYQPHTFIKKFIVSKS